MIPKEMTSPSRCRFPGTNHESQKRDNLLHRRWRAGADFFGVSARGGLALLVFGCHWQLVASANGCLAYDRVTGPSLNDAVAARPKRLSAEGATRALLKMRSAERTLLGWPNRRENQFAKELLGRFNILTLR